MIVPGEGSDNTVCVRFGMITSETDVVELLRLVEMTGKEQEESWKYIDTMAEVVKKGNIFSIAFFRL